MNLSMPTSSARDWSGMSGTMERRRERDEAGAGDADAPFEVSMAMARMVSSWPA